MLGLTMACAFGFLGIKYVEYSAKIHHGTLYGDRYVWQTDEHGGEHGASGDEAEMHSLAEAAQDANAVHLDAMAGGTQLTDASMKLPSSQYAPAPAGPEGFDINEPAEAKAEEATHKFEQPAKAHLFFSIYFIMTGLHGIHVVIGIICIFVIFVLSAKGAYNSTYYTPVDLVGLYWHLVDLIWIYLFPLLYLVD
ncbi:cytochrome c oxidase subunit 3 [bacterium]|nr:cytochrome c oxidase subunit 3 [bacterium]